MSAGPHGWRRIKRSDISDELVMSLARRWSAVTLRLGNGPGPGRPELPEPVLDALVRLGYPEKVALRKIEHMAGRGLLTWGVSPRCAFPNDYPTDA